MDPARGSGGVGLGKDAAGHTGSWEIERRRLWNCTGPLRFSEPLRVFLSTLGQALALSGEAGQAQQIQHELAA